MIVAIGGGELEVARLSPIDEFLVASTAKTSPRLLFLPTASRDAPGYCQKVEQYFSSGWGCEVRSLLLSKSPSPKRVAEQVDWADLVYAGGGDTLYLMRTWQRYGLGTLFREAHERGAVLAGISAGAICWFDGGIGSYNGYKPLPGLGLIPRTFLPHYEPLNRGALDSWFAENPAAAVLAVEDRAALAWDRGSFHVITDGPQVGGWRLTREGAEGLRSR